MKTISGHNVSQGGESKWARILPELIRDLSMIGAQYAVGSHLKGMQDKYQQGEKDAERTDTMDSAFSATSDGSMRMVGPSQTEILQAKSAFDPKLKEIDAEYNTSYGKGDITEYDGNKPMNAEMDPQDSAMLVGAMREPARPSQPPTAFNRTQEEIQAAPPQGMPPQAPQGMPEMPPQGMPPQEPQGAMAEGMPSQEPNAFDKPTQKLPPIILEGMELKKMGVDSKKIQRMLHHQMEVATYVASLPKALQGTIEPYLHVLESQQKYLLETYGMESKVMAELYKDALASARKKEDRSAEYDDKVKFAEEVDQPFKEKQLQKTLGSRERIAAGKNRVTLAGLKAKTDKELDNDYKELQGEYKALVTEENNSRDMFSTWASEEERQASLASLSDRKESLAKDMELIRLRKMELRGQKGPKRGTKPVNTPGVKYTEDQLADKVAEKVANGTPLDEAIAAVKKEIGD